MASIPGLGLVRSLVTSVAEQSLKTTFAVLERIYNRPRGGEMDPFELDARRERFTEGSMEVTMGRSYDWMRDTQNF